MSGGAFNSFRYNKGLYNAPPAAPVAAVVAGASERRSTGGTTGRLLAPTVAGPLEGRLSTAGSLGVAQLVVATAGPSASVRTAAGTLGSAGRLAGGGAMTGNRIIAQLAPQAVKVIGAGATAVIIRVMPAGSRGVPPAVVAAGGTVEPMRITTGAT